MTTATLAHSAYARSSAATASPAEVVRMAYERIITACDRATDAATNHGDGWVQRFHDETTRAQAILDELASVLAVAHVDPAVAAMSHDLAAIYAHASLELANANVRKDPAPLVGVRAAIAGLLDAWRSAVLAS